MENYISEERWIIENRGDKSIYETRAEARQIYLTEEIEEAKTIEDLKPILTRLLTGE